MLRFILSLLHPLLTYPPRRRLSTRHPRATSEGSSASYRSAAARSRHALAKPPEHRPVGGATSSEDLQRGAGDRPSLLSHSAIEEIGPDTAEREHGDPAPREQGRRRREHATENQRKGDVDEREQDRESERKAGGCQRQNDRDDAPGKKERSLDGLDLSCSGSGISCRHAEQPVDETEYEKAKAEPERAEGDEDARDRALRDPARLAPGSAWLVTDPRARDGGAKQWRSNLDGSLASLDPQGGGSPRRPSQRAESSSSISSSGFATRTNASSVMAIRP